MSIFTTSCCLCRLSGLLAEPLRESGAASAPVVKPYQLIAWNVTLQPSCRLPLQRLTNLQAFQDSAGSFCDGHGTPRLFCDVIISEIRTRSHKGIRLRLCSQNSRSHHLWRVYRESDLTSVTRLQSAKYEHLGITP